MGVIAPSGPAAAAAAAAVFAGVAYLIGGIPWALLIGKWVAHVDLRRVGSGNLGATNVARFLGGKWAVLVFALDFVKGALPVVAAGLLLAPAYREPVQVAAAVGAVLGHVYSPYIGFRGGKGIATSAGVAGGLIPWALLVGTVTFFAVALTSRRVSLGSLAIAVVAVPAVLFFYPGHPFLLVFGIYVSVLVVWKHRSNIGRLLRGEEPKVTWGIFKDEPKP